MKQMGWGQYPQVEAKTHAGNSNISIHAALKSPRIIARGNGRSYGDSALQTRLLSMRSRNRFIAFDETSGLLRCEAGVLLADIIEAFVPRGWFLRVTPGTKLITVGGAVASDVHGKNHHLAGCFSESVAELSLMLADGSIQRCSATQQPELFKATCGGMGLTGVILDVSFYLKKISSQWLEQTTIKAANLEQIFSAFEEHKTAAYSVAWLDCLAKGSDIGRSLLMLGDYLADSDWHYEPPKRLSVPFNLPGFVMNSWTVKLFNQLYYRRVGEAQSHSVVGIDSFFYPLDAIQNWNRIYGKRGFVQYQFILPKAQSLAGLKAILGAIAGRGLGSFLAVLKLYGPENNNYLSFPMEGYSLALDFKIQPGLFEFLDQLDKRVAEFGGRIYLTKDARMSPAVLQQTYPEEKLSKFRALREQFGANKVFHSKQSERLGL